MTGRRDKEIERVNPKVITEDYLKLLKGVILEHLKQPKGGSL